jgi:hypothetical protein
METTLRSEEAQPLFDKAIERFKEVRPLAVTLRGAAACCMWLFGGLAQQACSVCW